MPARQCRRDRVTRVAWRSWIPVSSARARAAARRAARFCRL